MKTVKILALLIALFSSVSALALTLSDAKSQGLVGETASGYLATVKVSTEAAKLVKSVNAKRKAHYQKIAQKNKLSLGDVEKRAGEKAIAKTAKGHYIKKMGNWVKK